MSIFPELVCKVYSTVGVMTGNASVIDGEVNWKRKNEERSRGAVDEGEKDRKTYVGPEDDRRDLLGKKRVS